MSQDDTPWVQSERQRRADDLLEEWAGEPEPASTSAYPEQWRMPEPTRRGRRRRKREESGYQGTAEQAVVVRGVRTPRQEFPVPDQDGLVSLPGYQPEPPRPARGPDGRFTGRGETRRSRRAQASRAGSSQRPGNTSSRGRRPDTRTASPGTPGVQQRRTRRRSNLGALIGVAVVIVAGVASALGNSSSDDGYDLADYGTELSPYGSTIDLTDLGVVPADTTFDFPANPELWDSEIDGWRSPRDLIRVYLDPELTVPAPDAWVTESYDLDDTLTVRPDYDTYLIVEDGSSTDITIGERWGTASEYYIAQLADLDTGTALDTIPVQRFEVEDYRPRPEVTAEVDTEGVLRLSWPAVDGATRYDVLQTTYGFTSLGQATGLSWASDVGDTPDGYRQNEVLAYHSGMSEDMLFSSPDYGVREVIGIAVSAHLADGRMTVVPVDSALLGQVPVRQAFNAWAQDGLDDWLDPSALPGSVPFQMADGSTRSLPVSYDVAGITERYSGVYEVPFTAYGAGPSVDNTLAIEADDRAQAVSEVEARAVELDAQRDPTGPPQPYTY